MTKSTTTGSTNTNAIARATTPAPALTIDWDLYGQYLEGSNLSEAEKRETIEALWSIVVSFVDLGFGIHPAQLATADCCERIDDKPNSGPLDAGSVVECSSTKRKTNLGEFGNKARGNRAATRQDRVQQINEQRSTK
ncbi:MAG: hypothetical protein GY927_03315 [bacterium]|nr:hypothetical protein [bacterium]